MDAPATAAKMCKIAKRKNSHLPDQGFESGGAMPLMISTMRSTATLMATMRVRKVVRVVMLFTGCLRRKRDVRDSIEDGMHEGRIQSRLYAVVLPMSSKSLYKLTTDAPLGMTILSGIVKGASV